MVRICLVLLILLFNIAQVDAFKDYEPEELPTLVSDFALSYEILESNGTPYLEPTVDGVKIIRITTQEALNGDYDMSLFIDNAFVTSEDNIQLPYEFNWNFKGLSNGEHAFVFVFSDSEEQQKGAIRINLIVQH